MRTVEEHLAGILAAVGPLAPVPLGLAEAHGCVLAEDVVAAAPLPGFDNSAMDGYAVRRADLDGASEAHPVVLPVDGDVAAGPAGALVVTPGRCVRIMTGAPLPPGADAVVPVEWTDGGVAEASFLRTPSPGAHVRRAGEDLAAGDLVLAAGTFLGAGQVGLLAAAGRAEVSCRPRPRVAVLSTGSELVEAGRPLGPGMLADSNSHALAAAVREAGAVPHRVGLVPDDPGLLLATLLDVVAGADAVVTSGGVSVGAYDVVKEVLLALGTVAFERVAMQPGMPQGFGTLGPQARPVFTLPGNPVSALVSFEVFVRPALRRMLDAPTLHRPVVTARAATALRSPPGRRSFLRVRLEPDGDGTLCAVPSGGPGSHLMHGYAGADALLVVPEDVEDVPAGMALQAVLLERRRA